MKLYLAAVTAPDASSVTDQWWFYPALGSAIVAFLVLVVWNKIPSQLKWFAGGIILVLFLLGKISFGGE